MSQHPLNIQPARMVLDGREWVDSTWAESLAEKLREKQRSKASHNHQFAAINDLFHNLPIDHAHAPYAASESAFRKHALIATGYCDTDVIDAGSHDVAISTAPIVAKHARAAHGYAIVTVRGSLVTCHTPQSQSFKAMGKERFHQSKEACLNWAMTLLGVAQ